MIDADFKKISNDIESLEQKIDQALSNYDRSGFENNHIYSELDQFINALSSVGSQLQYYQRNAIEGTLKKLENGRFEIPEIKMELSSGTPIEAMVSPVDGEDPRWCIGRVEYDNRYQHYYFYNTEGNNVPLCQIKNVRVRK